MDDSKAGTSRRLKRLLAASSLLLALAACGDDGEVTELARLNSPDGAWDAVLVRLQATKGQDSPYMVLMGTKGIGTGKAVRVFLGDHVSPQPEVTWESADRLSIRCDTARVWTYHNFFNAPNGSPAVSVALACGQDGYKP